MSHNQEQFLGRGGFGSVWLKACGQIVVKYPLDPNEKTKERFKDECEILEKLNHPNLITYLGIQEKDEQGNDKFGILMEYCERGDLEKLVFNPKWIYTMKWAITGAEQLFKALDYLWERKLTHRDIKPSNIFVDKNFLLKLGDFGTVREIEKTSTGTFDSGTVRYLPPPQFKNDHEKPEIDQRMISHKNDVYSLGLTMWEMIERRLIFDEYIQTNWRGAESFDRDKFTTDIQQKRLTHIQEPDTSPWRFVELVMKIKADLSVFHPVFSQFSCTQFNREMRPNAGQVLEIFLRSRAPGEEMWHHPDQLPMESNEPNLIKPIWFYYNDDGGTWKSREYEQISTDVSPFRRLSEASRFRHLYASLSPVDKEVFDATFPQTISNMAGKSFLFHEREKLGRLADQLQLKNDIFAYVKGFLMADQWYHLQLIAELIERYNYCTPSFLPWDNYAQINELIKILEIEQAKMLPSWKLSFKLYLSLSAMANEFLLFNDDPLSPILLKSDFTQRPRKGEWVPGTEKKVCRLGDEEFYLSEMTRTIDLAKILTLLEDIKDGIVRQTKHRLRRFVSLDESENRSKQIYDQEIGNRLKKGHVLFQLRNPPRHSCIHKLTCNLENFGNYWKQTYEFTGGIPREIHLMNFGNICEEWTTEDPAVIPDDLTFPVYSNHCLDYDCDYDAPSPCCSPSQDWLNKLLRWADICRWLKSLYEDPMGYHKCPIGFLMFLADCVIFMQVVSKRDENGVKYLTLLDHPMNYETYEKIWCMNESFILEEIHVSKIQQWVGETRPEERRYLSLILEAAHNGCSARVFQTLDHQGNVLPNLHDQLGTCSRCFPSFP